MHPDVVLTIPGARSRAPFAADLWNRHYADWLMGHRAQRALWNDKDGGQLVHLDPDGKTVAITSAINASSSGVTVSKPATFTGNVTIGDAASDTLTVEAVSTFKASATFQVNVTIGDAAGDTLTVNATAQFVNAVTFDGNVTLGNAAGDAIAVNGTTTANANVTLTGSSVLTLPAGSASAPSLAVGEGTTGLYRHAAGVLGATISGTQRLWFSGSIFQIIGVPALLSNAQAYRVSESGGTARDGLVMDSSNRLVVGQVNNETRVNGSTTRLQGNSTTRIELDGNGIGVFGATPLAQQSIAAAATDLASVITLANDLRSKLRSYGWFS